MSAELHFGVWFFYLVSNVGPITEGQKDKNIHVSVAVTEDSFIL